TVSLSCSILDHHGHPRHLHSFPTRRSSDLTVTSNKPLLQMGIDRKIFNVDKNITSQGGSAVDVMKNVPSVNLDIDGNVTLRNNRSEEHTSELQSREKLVCRLLLEKKKQ